MIKAVILDFDGLVIDTETIWCQVFQEWFLEKKQYSLSVDEFLMCVGSNAQRLFGILRETKGIDVDLDEFNRDTIEIFKEKSKNVPARPGIIDLLHSAKEKGLKIGLCTSSLLPKPVMHLTRLDLISLFDNLTTADDVEHVKPAPDLYLKSLEKLGVNADEAVAFEDSLNGYTAATRAGIKTCVIPNNVTKHSIFPPEYFCVPDLEETSLQEILMLLDKKI
ncbi:MAG: HAD family hydrolase [Brevinema sp.]